MGQFFWSGTVEQVTKNWFSMEEISKKRGQIGQLIENLAQVEHEGALQLPQLQFESPVRASSRRLRRQRTKPIKDDDLEMELSGEAKQPVAAGGRRLTRRRGEKELSQQLGSSAQSEMEVINGMCSKHL